MESNKQEKSNLLNDNPIARRAGGSWMSKHSVAGGSPLHKGGSYKGSPAHQEKEGFITYDSRTNRDGVGQGALMDQKRAAVNNAGKAYEAGTGTYNAYEESRDRFNVSKDSIGGVNKRIDRVMRGEEFEFKKPDGSPAQQKRKGKGESLDYGINDAQKARDKKNKVKCAPGQVKILGKCVTGANPKPKGGVTKNTSIKGTRANTEKAAAKAKKSPIKNKSTEKNGGRTHGEMKKNELHDHSMVHHLAKNPSSGKDKTQTIIDKAKDNKKKREVKKSPIKNNEGGQAHSQLGKKELRTHMKVKHGKKSPKVQLAKQPKVEIYKNPTFPDYNELPAKAQPVYKVKVKK
tara:strand:- start:504 stop:1541 length:1038 start_codon:yes stop_codon:yes gene_type:complete